jgi:hypothetical protein
MQELAQRHDAGISLSATQQQTPSRDADSQTG